jgi:diguanylate cyclase (GGDEF)-like protein
MTFAVDPIENAHAAAPSLSRLRRRSSIPATGGEPSLLQWALTVTAAAERRVAELEARLAYFEGLSTSDELTCALNRRGFLFEFSRAIAAARRGGQGGAIIIGDLDGFKAVNDRHGHAGGNEVLRQIATLMKRRIRKMDALGRLGGDEFAILLIGADMATARQKCACLVRAFASSPPQLDGRPVNLGASFGIAVYDGSETEEEVLHRADLAMYAEKRAMRAEEARRA